MISRWLRLLAIVPFLAIAGLAYHQLVQTHDAVLADSAQQMARLDMVFAEQTGRALESVDLILRGVIESVAPRLEAPGPEAPRLEPPGLDRPAIETLLRQRTAGVRQVKELLVLDRDGRVIYGSRRDAPTDLSLTSQPFVRDYLDDPNRGLQIGNPFRDYDGRWTVYLTRPIRADAGALIGSAVAALDPQYFEDFYKAVDLSPDGAISLHRYDGTVLARYPHDDRIMGTSFAKLPPFRDVLARGLVAGTVRLISPLDGRPRVLAIRALPAFPLAINVSVGEDAVLAEWWRQALLFSFSGLAAAAVIAGLLLVLARQSRRVETAAGDAKVARQAVEAANLQLRAHLAERDRAEAALRQVQRIEAVSQLTSGVAHDFNNLLTVILGSLLMLRRSPVLGPEEAKRLDVMESAARRGATLTDQLLAFSRKQPLVPSAVDLNRVIAAMEGLLRSTLGGTIRIETALTPQPWAAMVDPTQIELVILNLALNARDAMPGGGSLVIGTANVTLEAGSDIAAQGDYVMVSVADNGMGMTEAVKAQACEPFFTTKGPGKGSGLGLSQAFGVTRQLGGGLVIESAPERGTTIGVYLPRAAAAAQEADEPAPRIAAAELAQPGPRVVLLVDDDEAVREVTASVLEDLGYRVIGAPGGAAALDWLRQKHRIDVVLTDLAMPEMNGAELARRARELRRDLPVVFLSGYADPETLADDLRPERLVRKPFQSRELATKLKAAIDERNGPVGLTAEPAPVGLTTEPDPVGQS